MNIPKVSAPRTVESFRCRQAFGDMPNPEWRLWGAESKMGHQPGRLADGRPGAAGGYAHHMAEEPGRDMPPVDETPEQRRLRERDEAEERRRRDNEAAEQQRRIDREEADRRRLEQREADRERLRVAEETEQERLRERKKAEAQRRRERDAAEQAD